MRSLSALSIKRVRVFEPFDPSRLGAATSTAWHLPRRCAKHLPENAVRAPSRPAVSSARVRGGLVTADFEQVDFFSNESLLEDPYPYFEHLRSKCPVTPLPHHGVMAVSGYDEAFEVYRDVETFSSCNSVVGPFATFPEPLEGDDVSELIERFRPGLPMNEHMVTMDPPEHTRQRALLMRLLTPKRLKQNEEFMWRLADQQLDEFLADRRCEFI